MPSAGQAGAKPTCPAVNTYLLTAGSVGQSDFVPREDPRGDAGTSNTFNSQREDADNATACVLARLVVAGFRGTN